MQWTFGIITNGTNPDGVDAIIDSIKRQNIDDDYEIIIVGGPDIHNQSNVTHIEFDESLKTAWITKKKNLVFQAAKFDNVSIGHDYVAYHRDWYKRFVKFGEDWDMAMCRIESLDGSRFRDWVSFYDGHIRYVDYDDHSQTDKMYCSGTYFIAKKQFMLENPLDESLCWGQGEDLEHATRVRDRWRYKMNRNSSVWFLKPKDTWPPATTENNFKQEG